MSGLSAWDTAALWCAASRGVALFAAGTLLVPALAGCGAATSGGSGGSGVGQSVAMADREELAAGGVVTWGVDALPATLNAFQYDAGPVTDQVASAVLPMLFTVDGRGRPQLNADFLRSAEITEREPKQTVVYTLNPRAVWNDGEPLGADDFVAQWKALRGADSTFWSARNVGYDRVERVAKGPAEHQVEVTFARPYADWRSLFTPLYPRAVMADAKSFNEGVRTELPAAAGPFELRKFDTDAQRITLVRNKVWWGEPALLDELVFAAVPADQRRSALAGGEIDVLEIGPTDAARIASATAEKSAVGAPGRSDRPAAGQHEAVVALGEWVRARLAATDADPSDTSRDSGGSRRKQRAAERAGERYVRTLVNAERDRHRAFAARENGARERLGGYTVHRAYDAAYTQLAMNGTSKALSDERVRWAVARGLDRQALAEEVHGPAGLPAKPLGSHLRMLDQVGYQDNSGALGETGLVAAAQQLDDAGWRAVSAEPAADAAEGDAREGERDDAKDTGRSDAKAGDDRALAPVVPPVPLTATHPAAEQRAAVLRQAADVQRRAAKKHPGSERSAAEALERAAKETAKAAEAAALAARQLADQAPATVRTKKGQPLRLRFVLPGGPGAEQLWTVGRRIAATLATVGIRAEITEVEEEAYFRDYVAEGDFDLALYSWPATAYPATDARPLFAKPQAIPGGELFIEQNFTRIGTDHIDQLLDQAAGELDEKEQRSLLNKADARIWAAAGSIPLYQRPQLVAVTANLAGVGAYGLETPRYQDIGYHK